MNSEYLSQHIEPFDKKKALTILYEYFQPIESTERDGKEVFTLGNVSFFIKYDEDFDDNNLPKGIHPEESDDWTQLKSLFIVNNDSNAQLDITGLLNSDDFFRIYVNRAGNNFRKSNSVDKKYKYIQLNNPINSIGSIVSLLHEIGHIHDENMMTDKQIEINREARRKFAHKNAREKDFEIILASERKAWSFALNKLKPFLDKDDSESPLSKQKIQEFIHDLSLGSYGQTISERIDSQNML